MTTPSEKSPEDYIAEQVRDAIAREAHELGITVTVKNSEAHLEGCVESDAQRRSVEDIARRVAPEHSVNNRIEVVSLGKVKKESMP